MWLEWGLNAGIMMGTFLFMEGVAWFTHKYIMHGFMWTWHESHHQIRHGAFEKNDWFAVVFAIPSVLTIVLGREVESLWFLFYVGFGIMGYGIFYFIFHDVLVHRRIKIKFIARSKYMKRIMRAHYIHHAVHSKQGAEAFGFLFAPKKYEAKS